LIEFAVPEVLSHTVSPGVNGGIGFGAAQLRLLHNGGFVLAKHEVVPHIGLPFGPLFPLA
jgi:hypothetical protein